MIRDVYNNSDFDFAVVYIESLAIFYVIPVDVFTSYGSSIHLVEVQKRQRKPKSLVFSRSVETNFE